jgi:cytochrome b pre-mRNA-processing protein 3
MFKRLFGYGSRPDRILIDALYDEIVAAARQPVLYADWQVPDTPLGRYEMMALHVFLVLHRLKSATGEARDAAQALTDEFFKEVEHSIRELGVGDMGVPKRMKKLAGMFYGRAASYEAALEAGDRAALAAAFSRNVRPGVAEWPQAADLASYAFDCRDALAVRPLAALIAGRGVFRAAQAVGGDGELV